MLWLRRQLQQRSSIHYMFYVVSLISMPQYQYTNLIQPTIAPKGTHQYVNNEKSRHHRNIGHDLIYTYLYHATGIHII